MHEWKASRGSSQVRGFYWRVRIVGDYGLGGVHLEALSAGDNDKKWFILLSLWDPSKGGLQESTANFEPYAYDTTSSDSDSDSDFLYHIVAALLTFGLL
jgi:hypothetical protein